MKKAIFLGVTNLHSTKKNQDYRKVDIYTPPFKGPNGFTYGGVQSYFTALDSTVGNGLAVGTIVIPQIEYDPYMQREDLKGFEVVKESPYEKTDFE